MTVFSTTARSTFRILGPAAMVAALGLGTVPAFAQTAPTSTDCSPIHFELANPSAGSEVDAGPIVIQGLAMDSRATTGTGIDRIDFFLDSRDQGGVSLGSVTPGMITPFGADSFQTTIALPNMVGGHDLVGYAYSSVTGQQVVISVPFALGEDPAKAGLTSAQGTTPSTLETCLGGTTTATSTSTSAPAATTPAVTTAPATTAPAVEPAPLASTTTAPAATTTGSSTITFDVGNPSPGDTVHAGGYAIDGTAMDRAAQSGSGIDRIEIFLDSRDQGGMMLGQAVMGPNNQWHAMVTLPTNQTGLHTLSFYARSAVNGAESAVSVPVTIAP